METAKARLCDGCRKIVLHDKPHFNLEQFITNINGEKPRLVILKRYFCGIDCLTRFCENQKKEK